MGENDYTRIPGSRERDRRPGSLDMSTFERSYSLDLAADPVLQWAILWPDGHAMLVESEDAALALARTAHGCRVVRRYVSPWVAQPPSA